MRYLGLASLVVFAGCAVVEQIETGPRAGDEAAGTSAPPPPENARTVEDFDTTSAAERTAAAATGDGGALLGRTVASLGDPAKPGFWMTTPLVTFERPGRIEYPQKGTKVEVTLIPSDGASSRVSLAALRLLDAPLADLSELDVFAN